MKKVLVTGGEGFIGRHVLRPLRDRNFEIHLLARRRGEERGIFLHSGDLFEEEGLTSLINELRPTHLLHLAWYTFPGNYWSAAENLRWVWGSLRLIDRFISAGGSRVVAAGTCAEYDWSEGPCVEGKTSEIPRSLYGVCKKELGSLVSQAAGHLNFSAAWGRIFHLYGPGEKRVRLVPSLVVPLLNGQAAMCSDGEQVRDFLFVADVASALVALLDSAVTGPVNIASGEPIRLKDVARRIAAKTQSMDRLRVDNNPLNEITSITANVDRLRHEVGWRPDYTLDEGLDASIAWWKTKGGSGRCD